MNKNIKSTNLGTVGKIIIPERIENIINTLHSKVGAIEWSGILFYKLTKGNIKSMKNLEFTAEFIYPMNIGSSAYTEFDYNTKLLNAYDINEELMECDSGLVHTHHNMGAFFSGTDISEICDNATNFNYYISLVLDFKKEYKCKIAFPSKTNINKKYSIKDNNGNPINLTSKTESTEILIGDLDIEIAINIPWLNERITGLKKENKAAATVNVSQQSLFPINNYGLNSYSNLPIKNTLFTDTQFTSTILNMDIKKKDTGTYSTLKNLCSLDIEELGLYEEGLDVNMKRLYLECYPSDVAFSKLSEKCLNSLLEISKLKVFEDEMIVVSIREILKSYV